MEILIRKLGNSTGVTFPAAFSRELELTPGQSLIVERNDDRSFTLKPKSQRKRFTAAELNKLCNPNAPMPQDLIEFADAKPVGSEVL
jgi:antitoxin ChpS